ncbi:phage baseplate assembly protein V [Chitinophagaceae bacterium 26-R-25]|nr:phage baseplate assembly protein V [Chitinophagaceae bacterium 26-R-25]
MPFASTDKNENTLEGAIKQSEEAVLEQGETTIEKLLAAKAEEKAARAMQAAQQAAAQTIPPPIEFTLSPYTQNYTTESDMPEPQRYTPAPYNSSSPVRVGYSVYISDEKIFNIASIKIEEKYGAPNALEIKLFTDGIQDPASMYIDGAEKFLGKTAEITLQNTLNPKEDRLESLFVITDVQLEQDGSNGGMLVLLGSSPDCLLQGMPHYEAFVETTLEAIVQKAFRPHQSLTKADLRCQPNFVQELPFACCFNQNYFDFLQRYAHELGEWQFFDGRRFVFGQLPSYAQTKLVYGQNCSQLKMGMSITAIQGSLEGYDAAGHNPITKNTAENGGNIHYYNERAYKQSAKLFGKNMSAQPGTLTGDGALQAMAKARSKGRAADLYCITGKSINWCLHLGKTAEVSFSVNGDEKPHMTVRIIGVKHWYEAGGKYENTFTAIPANAMTPPPVNYKEPSTHPVLAEVTDNKDSLGRVKVKFMGWNGDRNNNSSNWLRVLTPDAGGDSKGKVAANRGFVTIPEIGDQVMVDFRNGNPEMPFVTGSVFHSKSGTGGGSGNNVKSLTSKSGHTIQLNDGEGILLKDKSKLQHITLDGDNAISIGAKSKITLKVGEDGGCIEIDGKNITIKGLNISVEGVTGDAAKLDIKAKDTTFCATTKFDITSATTTIKGESILTGGKTHIDGGYTFLN